MTRAATFAGFYLEELTKAGAAARGHGPRGRPGRGGRRVGCRPGARTARRPQDHGGAEGDAAPSRRRPGRSPSPRKADRIEVTADGHGHILDYKTGKRALRQGWSKTGFSPQLTLTAAILEAGGFPERGPAEASAT